VRRGPVHAQGRGTVICPRFALGELLPYYAEDHAASRLRAVMEENWVLK
jgi:hypothetical protein